MPQQIIRIACIAPPMTDEKYAAYRSLINGVEASPLRDALEKVFQCMSAWWNARESTLKPKVLSTGTDMTEGPDVSHQNLDKALMKELDTHIPWMEEIQMYEELFDKIPNTPDSKPLRDAAFHLSWFAKELFLDREPITMERIVA